MPYKPLHEIIDKFNPIYEIKYIWSENAYVNF